MISIDPASVLREKLADGIEVERSGNDSYMVYVPFVFDDGDQLTIHATRKSDELWELSDDGDVLHRAREAGGRPLSDADLDRIRQIAEFYGAREVNGALDFEAKNDELAFALFAFTQSCLEATWVARSKPPARRTERRPQFLQKLDKLIGSCVEKSYVTPHWYDAENDPKELYRVDYKIKTPNRQLFLFAVSSNYDCAQATISCLHHKQAGTKFDGIAVYDEELNIPKKLADQLNDTVDWRFPRVSERKTISEFFAKLSI